MDFINKVIEFFNSPLAASVFAVLWVISETLASIPSVESNSIFQIVKKVIAWLVAKFPKKA